MPNDTVVGQVVRHVPFVSCGHSSWPTTDVKGSANQDKDMKTGHYKER